MITGTDLTDIAPDTLTVSADAAVSPSAATLRDFSSPVIYTVTAEDGTTARYTVTVSVTAPSSDSALSGLAVKDGSDNSLSPSPVFQPDTTSYTLDVGSGVSAINVSAAARDAGASVTINGVTISSASVGLTYGTNTVEIVVEAEDGTTTTYTLTVTRAAAPTSDDADLTGITLSNGRLSPEPFDKDITNYTVDLTNSVSTEAVTPILSDEGASYVIMVRGNTLVDAGRPVSLDVGANVFTITVTASDGSTKKTYAISVSRAKAGGGGGGVSGRQ